MINFLKQHIQRIVFHIITLIQMSFGEIRSNAKMLESHIIILFLVGKRLKY